MRNIKLTIEYDGTNFSGWQVQKDKRTIEQEIETALSKILKEEVKVIGSGRTDAGVHARGQVASVKLSKLYDAQELKDCFRQNSTKEAILPLTPLAIVTAASLPLAIAIPLINSSALILVLACKNN